MKKTNLAIFMPITSHIKGYPFEVLLTLKDVKGVILADQVRSVDRKSRNAKKITQISSDILKSDLQKLSLLLEI
jgi:mRNA interferase MazF